MFVLLDDARASFLSPRQHVANRGFGRDEFFESFARLSGVSDLADELLARRASPGTYGAWNERDGGNARRAWRDRAASDPLRPVRDYRNVSTRGLDKAAEGANLNSPGLPRLTFHDLRHTYGSHLAQSGLDPVGVQRQLGHARPSITIDLYVHEFETARRREQVGERLASALGGLIAD